MELSDYTELFLAEAREHLSTMSRLLLHLERDPDDRSAIDELFRAVHTLKGTSAAMGYAGVSGMAHALEHTLDGVRAGRALMHTELVDTMLVATDALERELDRQAAGGSMTGPADGDGAGRRLVRAYVTLAREAVFPAVRALLVLRAAREIGEVTDLEPSEAKISAGECGHHLTILLDTSSSEADVVSRLTAAGEVERVEIALPSSSAVVAPAEPAGPMVRVAQAKLDTLSDHVGELVFSRDRLLRVASPESGSELEEVVNELSALIGRVRDEVMTLRRVSAAEALDRLPRAVRDTARALGKEIEFELVGRESHFDRSVLREAVDLLIHLLRNAVDHGIESPDEREAAGKPRTGRVRLSAIPERSAAVLRVEDDGRGLQREEILRVAVERGLVKGSDAAALPDSEVLSLITQPGFSTAPEITDVSGRGVGLDVVRARVEALGGTMELQSEPGAGTTFTLRLPLTLSIVRVLHLNAAGETYALPISAVEEVGEVLADAVREEDGREAAELRDEPLALVRLPRILAAAETEGDGERTGTGAASGKPARPIPLVVVAAGGRRFGLLLDGIRGQGEAVVKHFDAPAGTLPLFSGATLLDDGRPALILDAERLATLV